MILELVGMGVIWGFFSFFFFFPFTKSIVLIGEAIPALFHAQMHWTDLIRNFTASSFSLSTATNSTRYLPCGV